MSQSELQQEFQNQVSDVFSRLQSKQMVLSDWNNVIYIGMILLLIMLVVIHCCCFCYQKPKRHKVSRDNIALEP